MLWIGIRDPVLFDPGIRDRSKIRIRIGSYFESLKNNFFGLKYLNSLMRPGSGMEKIRIREPGWKKFGSMIGVKHPGSETLIY